MFNKSINIPEVWKADKEIFQELRATSASLKSEKYHLFPLCYYNLDSVKFCGSFAGDAHNKPLKLIHLSFNDDALFTSNKIDFGSAHKMPPLIQLILGIYKSVNEQVVLFLDLPAQNKFKICIPVLNVGKSGENIETIIYYTHWINTEWQSKLTKKVLLNINDIMQQTAKGNAENTFDAFTQVVREISTMHFFDGVELNEKGKNNANILKLYEIFASHKEAFKQALDSCTIINAVDNFRHNHKKVELEELWHFIMKNEELKSVCIANGIKGLSKLISMLPENYYGEFIMRNSCTLL